MTMILWATAAAIFFAVTNAISYKRGNTMGYNEGYEAGVIVKIKQVGRGEYLIDPEEE